MAASPNPSGDAGGGATPQAGALPASGRQLQLRAGAMTATVAEVGAALRTLSVDGRPVAVSQRDEEIAEYAEGQALVPWPNRVAGGSYEFAGRTHQLPLSEPSAGNAIHGLTRWVPWDITRADEHAATLSVVIHPQAGYPFRLAVAVTYALAGRGLTVTTTARNIGSDPLPYGCGFHPYLTVGTSVIDDAVLTVPAASVLAVDERGIPTGERRPVDGTRCDFRSARAIEDVELDTVFADLARDDDGRAAVEVATPDGAASVRLWVDESHPYLMAFTGDPLPERRRRRSLAIEPMTCAPDALRSGDGLRVLEPGEEFTSRWGIDTG